MLKRFIERSILSSVVSFAIIVLGGIGLYMLSVESYPDIAPPTVEVTATYSGASADAVLSSVIMPLEEQINGVEGMNYMTSIATSSGSASITVFFKKGVDPDMAVVNVQNRVARAAMLLPQEVNQIGVKVDKKQATAILMLTVSSGNPDFDDKFIFNYSNINIIPEIQRITGVGSAEVMGAKDYSMRIWLKPDVMASYKISPDEVVFALKDQNIEAAAGELGLIGNQAFQYPLKYTGKLKTPEQFENIIIRNNNGQILRVKDVADVELGSIIYSVHSEMDKKAAAVISINQTPGSNAQQIIKDVKKKLEEASVDFPPGLEITYIKDDSAFLSASISKVVSTLFEAFLLVFLVVFVFLQRFRYTVIPVVAVPISIIGAFVFMLLFGFTINILTLFALVLAIGTVVDDPIVVVEAVHAKIQSGVKNSKKATQEAMKEITPAIISITLVLMAVFLPVSFMGGTSGIFFRQFGLTIASAILISAVVALTLSCI